MSVNYLFMMNDEIQRLETILEEKKLSRPALLRDLGISPQIYNNWVKRGIPKQHLMGVANFIDTSVEYLLEGEHPSSSLELEQIALKMSEKDLEAWKMLGYSIIDKLSTTTGSSRKRISDE